MTRNIDDNPSGWSRNLPGHTVELEPGFAVPWCQTFSQSISGSSQVDFTINFTDPNNLYFVDIVFASPQDNTVFTVFARVLGVNYVAATGQGKVNFSLRTNPSIVFISGDSLVIRVINHDANAKNFIVCINGTKIKRPSNYGHVPMVSFSPSSYLVGIDESITFTDLSSYSPTSWEWYFEPGILGSTLQNPVYQYLTPGNKWPVLKAANQYGWDSGALVQPIVVCPGVRADTFTEYDPIGKIYPDNCQSGIIGVGTNETAYIYRDYGASYFSNIELTFKISIHNYITTDSECVAVAIGNSVGDCFSASGYRYVVLVSKNSGNLTLRLRLHSGSTFNYGGDPALSVAVDTNYWCRFVRPAGQTYGVLYVYNDEGMTSLRGTLTTNSVSGGDTQFRYLYLPSSYNYGASGHNAGCTVIGLKVVSH